MDQLTQELVQWESHHREFMNAAMSTFLSQQDALIEDLHGKLERANARLQRLEHEKHNSLALIQRPFEQSPAKSPGIDNAAVQRLRATLRQEQEAGSKRFDNLLSKYNLVKDRNIVLEKRVMDLVAQQERHKHQIQRLLCEGSSKS